MTRLRSFLGALLLASCLAGGARAELANLDPLDPASCKHPDGFVVVAKDWVISLDEAYKAGKLANAQYTDLSVWWTAMMNWMVETDRVEETCLALIEARRTHHF